MAQIIDVGLKEGLFAVLFVWLFFRQIKQSEARENKLYGFLEEFKMEFGKLVGSYETLTKDVTEIRQEMLKTNEKLDSKMDKHDYHTDE